MDATLLLALAGVYVLGVVGIVVVGTLVETPDHVPESLEQRLAGVRSIAPADNPKNASSQPAYFVGGTPKRLVDRRRARGL